MKRSSTVAPSAAIAAAAPLLLGLVVNASLVGSGSRTHVLEYPSTLHQANIQLYNKKKAALQSAAPGTDTNAGKLPVDFRIDHAPQSFSNIVSSENENLTHPATLPAKVPEQELSGFTTDSLSLWGEEDEQMQTSFKPHQQDSEGERLEAIQQTRLLQRKRRNRNIVNSRVPSPRTAGQGNPVVQSLADTLEDSKGNTAVEDSLLSNTLWQPGRGEIAVPERQSKQPLQRLLNNGLWRSPAVEEEGLLLHQQEKQQQKQTKHRNLLVRSTAVFPVQQTAEGHLICLKGGIYGPATSGGTLFESEDTSKTGKLSVLVRLPGNASVSGWFKSDQSESGGLHIVRLGTTSSSSGEKGAARAAAVSKEGTRLILICAAPGQPVVAVLPQEVQTLTELEIARKAQERSERVSVVQNAAAWRGYLKNVQQIQTAAIALTALTLAFSLFQLVKVARSTIKFERNYEYLALLNMRHLGRLTGEFEMSSERFEFRQRELLQKYLVNHLFNRQNQKHLRKILTFSGKYALNEALDELEENVQAFKAATSTLASIAMLVPVSYTLARVVGHHCTQLQLRRRAVLQHSKASRRQQSLGGISQEALGQEENERQQQLHAANLLNPLLSTSSANISPSVEDVLGKEDAEFFATETEEEMKWEEGSNITPDRLSEFNVYVVVPDEIHASRLFTTD